MQSLISFIPPNNDTAVIKSKCIYSIAFPKIIYPKTVND